MRVPSLAFYKITPAKKRQATSGIIEGRGGDVKAGVIFLSWDKSQRLRGTEGTEGTLGTLSYELL
jgi:hypothetical protein